MYVELGKIVGVWGVKGWVKLHSYTRERGDIANYQTWLLQSSNATEPPQQYKVLNCRAQGPGIVAQLEGVDTRELAAALSGQTILVHEDQLPPLPQGEYYWQQLIGLQVSNLQGENLGIVDSIMETGANDVLVLKSQSGDEVKEVLIPYTDAAVKEIDLDSGSMTVDWDLSYLD
ncbi:MAG: ribosome maturation factor RimM [Gammaproteobacteria bacterium]|nr:ribosome maturation factor RimM [Gammaproteobacteria bacterium]